MIGGAPLASVPHAGLDERVAHAFRIAFVAAALLCLLGAWAARRVPTLRFEREEAVTPPSVD